MNWSSKSRQFIKKHLEPHFRFELKWGFVIQRVSRPEVIEVEDILFNVFSYIKRIAKMEINEEFFLDPAVKRFIYRVVCRSSGSTHGALNVKIS